MSRTGPSSWTRRSDRLGSAIVLAGLLLLLPGETDACWKATPLAERAFKEGFQLYREGDWAAAFAKFEQAKGSRDEPDGNCAVQLYGRGRNNKAYYLPNFYLAVTAYRNLGGYPDQTARCEEAVRYLATSLQCEDTLDLQSSRLRMERPTLRDMMETCDPPTQAAALGAWGELRLELARSD